MQQALAKLKKLSRKNGGQTVGIWLLHSVELRLKICLLSADLWLSMHEIFRLSQVLGCSKRMAAQQLFWSHFLVVY
jgi:hypothetical protein